MRLLDAVQSVREEDELEWHRITHNRYICEHQSVFNDAHQSNLLAQRIRKTEEAIEQTLFPWVDRSSAGIVKATQGLYNEWVRIFGDPSSEETQAKIAYTVDTYLSGKKPNMPRTGAYVA